VIRTVGKDFVTGWCW